MPSSLLQVVNNLFETCHNKLGTSSANTSCGQLVNRLVTTCLQTCNNLRVHNISYSQVLVRRFEQRPLVGMFEVKPDRVICHIVK